MGRPVEHDEATGVALLDAAEAILAEEGPDAISVRRVANAVNVTTRAVYTVFGNKDGLLAELAARGHRILGQNLVKVPLTDNVQEDLLNLGYQAFRTFATSRPHLYRLAFERITTVASAQPKVAEASRVGVKTLIDHIKRGQDAGVLRQGDPAQLALIYHAMTVGLVNWELAHPSASAMGRRNGKLNKVSVENMWREGLAAVIRGLAPADAVV
ncbi:MAG: TetR/AcrR family transcriptional regulator [Salinisphaeraceae bacterium]|nr:TetR/AcrR family transcriptional regulator [Salinisphaeraceae bacterium]